MLAVAAVLMVALVAPAAPASADSAAAKMVRKVNEYRQNRGIPPVRMSRSLNRSSARYARHMMNRNYFGHSGRIRASRRFRRLGEIIEMHRGYRSNPSAALRSWAGSPGHASILTDRGFNYVGAGVVKGRFRGRRTTMWVMHFGRK